MQLTYLLRYPPSQAEDGAPHHAILLLRQASSLEMSRTPSAGATVMTENRNLLNIPLEVPDPIIQMRRRARPPISSSDLHGTSSGQGEHMRQMPSFQMGLPELLARGLMDRGESLGINKTVMNAVSELRVSQENIESFFLLICAIVAQSPRIGRVSGSHTVHGIGAVCSIPLARRTDDRRQARSGERKPRGDGTCCNRAESAK